MAVRGVVVLRWIVVRVRQHSEFEWSGSAVPEKPEYQEQQVAGVYGVVDTNGRSQVYEQGQWS